MHVIFDRLARGFLGRLEKRSDIDIKADIGEGGGDHLGTAIMTILPELHHQHAGPAALLSGEGFDLALDAVEPFITLAMRGIDAGDRAGGRLMAGENLLERVRNLAHRGARARRFYAERQEIALAVARPFGKRAQRRFGAAW